jgi:O-antigen/teichoic acid export membrane protein
MTRTYRYLQKLWLGLLTAVLLMILLADPVYSLWVGDRVTVPHLLNICMGVFIMVSCWNNITVAVMNGLGKVRLQLYYSVFSAIINIPLAILFGRVLHMGSAGVILGTSVSLLIGSVAGALQARKLITGTARGVWNQ